MVVRADVARTFSDPQILLKVLKHFMDDPQKNRLIPANGKRSAYTLWMTKTTQSQVLYVSTALLVQVECVRCPWALQAKHIGPSGVYGCPLALQADLITFLPKGVGPGF